VASTTATSIAYSFPLDLTKLAQGQYKVCYCEERSTLSAAAGVSYTYFPEKTDDSTDNTWAKLTTFPTTLSTQAGTTVTDLQKPLSQYTCAAMCSSGCFGDQCFCGAYGTAAAADGALCLPAPLCRKACDEHASCVGFVDHRTEDLCFLYAHNAGARAALNTGQHNAAMATTTDRNYDTYQRMPVSSCAEWSDFGTTLGPLWVTSRPQIGAQWVITPNEPQSIEVLGDDLRVFHDRILLAHSNGTCGASGPQLAALVEPYKQANTLFDLWYSNYSTRVECEAGGSCPWDRASKTMAGVAFFNTWVPYGGLFQDSPSDNSLEAPVAPPAPAPATAQWNTRENSYCGGGNLASSAIPPGNDNITASYCYPKCGAADCVGSGCYCDGLYSGYDDVDSAALCLPQEECLNACAQLGDLCHSVDMHSEISRCFLNGPGEVGGCREQLMELNGAKLRTLDTYDYFFKLEARRTQVTTMTPDGASCEHVLRFRHVQFRAGGTFKVCFCDQDLLDGSLCSSAEDYKIEIGTVHASGVSCLVHDSRFRKGTCREQTFGGLRCYEGAAPTVPVCAPEVAQEVVAQIPQATVVAPLLSAFCVYGPEEMTRTPACAG